MSALFVREARLRLVYFFSSVFEQEIISFKTYSEMKLTQDCEKVQRGETARRSTSDIVRVRLTFSKGKGSLCLYKKIFPKARNVL